MSSFGVRGLLAPQAPPDRSTVSLVAGNLSGSRAIAARAAPRRRTTLLLGPDQYSALSACTLSTTSPGVSGPSGNQAFNGADQSSSAFPRPTRISAVPGRGVHSLCFGFENETF